MGVACYFPDGARALTTDPAAPESLLPLAPCELCGKSAPLNAANICAACHAEGMATLEGEAEEHAVWVAEQLELGPGYKWL